MNLHGVFATPSRRARARTRTAILRAESSTGCACPRRRSSAHISAALITVGSDESASTSRSCPCISSSDSLPFLLSLVSQTPSEALGAVRPPGRGNKHPGRLAAEERRMRTHHDGTRRAGRRSGTTRRRSAGGSRAGYKTRNRFPIFVSSRVANSPTRWKNRQALAGVGCGISQSVGEFRKPLGCNRREREPFLRSAVPESASGALLRNERPATSRSRKSLVCRTFLCARARRAKPLCCLKEVCFGVTAAAEQLEVG